MITLKGKRVLLCGKGGSGKSTITALMAEVLRKRGYRILVVNGDASNPDGLTRVIFQRRIKEAPKALIEHFGGFKAVTCPIKDPQVMTRVNDSTPLTEKRIDLLQEIPSQYYIEERGIYLFLAGVIDRFGQCDGPIEKVVRDFVVEGDWVSLVDMKGGLGQFGRRVPDVMDIILCILDPTLEAVSMAERVARFCREMNMQNFWFVLNKIESADMKSIIMEQLGELRTKVLGSVVLDRELPIKQLSGDLSISMKLSNDVEMAVKRLEVFSSCVDSGWDEL